MEKHPSSQKWTITVSGAKAAARKAAIEQCDRNIAAGNQTQQQKDAVITAIDGIAEANVSGTISGTAAGSPSITVDLKGSNE